MTRIKRINTKDEEFLVHAVHQRAEIIRHRYEDEWFIQPKELGDPEKVLLKDAATHAAKHVKNDWLPKNRSWGSTMGSRIFWGQEGGEEFDIVVKELEPMLFIEISYIDLGDGRPFMGMKCPGCGEWMKISNTQLEGRTCTDHSRSIGGCGFHGYAIGPHSGYIPDVGDIIKKKNEAKKQAKRSAEKK